MSYAEVSTRIEKLAPEIRGRLDEIEQARTVPTDLVAELRSAGCFRAILPESYGGEGMTIKEEIHMIEELCAVDGSVGWTVMIGSSAAGLFALLPKTTFEAIYADGPDVIGGGTLAPKGQARETTNGYSFSGQWPFASGCLHCDYLGFHSFVVGDDGAPKMTDRGPEMRFGIVPRDRVEIVDTWHVSGLKGTGSHDLRVENVEVDRDWTGILFGGAPQVEGTIFQVPILVHFTLAVASCAVGIARGALNEALELAKSKRPAFKPMERVAEDPLARLELGRAALLLDEAEALLDRRADEAWQAATAQQEPPLTERARARATGWRATKLAVEVVEIAYASGGGTSLYESSNLQRRLRDVHAVTQHAAVGRDPVAWLGGFLLDEPVPQARL